MAAARRGVLVLRGDDDLVPIARALHRRVVGAEGPFIVCDPGRPRSEATAHFAANHDTGMAAVAAAAGGTVCARIERLPADFPEVVASFRLPNARFRLVVCAQSLWERAPYLGFRIAFPPLADRAGELDRIITEYAQDAFGELGVARRCLAPDDHEWIRRHASWSLPTLEKSTLRLVALRASDSLDAAAARLGISCASLAQWVERRKVPVHAPCSCCSHPRPVTRYDDLA